MFVFQSSFFPPIVPLVAAVEVLTPRCSALHQHLCRAISLFAACVNKRLNVRANKVLSRCDLYFVSPPLPCRQLLDVGGSEFKAFPLSGISSLIITQRQAFTAPLFRVLPFFFLSLHSRCLFLSCCSSEAPRELEVIIMKLSSGESRRIFHRKPAATALPAVRSRLSLSTEEACARLQCGVLRVTLRV